jgi:hypothetical protein
LGKYLQSCDASAFVVEKSFAAEESRDDISIAETAGPSCDSTLPIELTCEWRATMSLGEESQTDLTDLMP